MWAEITVAARTDPELRERVQPAIDARWALIRCRRSGVPWARRDGVRPHRDVWLQLMRGTIELAPLLEPLLATLSEPQRERDERPQPGPARPSPSTSGPSFQPD